MHGKGIGKRATFLFLYHVFRIRQFEKVYVHSMDTNIRNLNLNGKFGFELEGVFLQDILLKEQRRDVVRMALVRPWRSAELSRDTIGAASKAEAVAVVRAAVIARSRSSALRQSQRRGDARELTALGDEQQSADELALCDNRRSAEAPSASWATSALRVALGTHVGS